MNLVRKKDLSGNAFIDRRYVNKKHFSFNF